MDQNNQSAGTDINGQAAASDSLFLPEAADQGQQPADQAQQTQQTQATDQTQTTQPAQQDQTQQTQQTTDTGKAQVAQPEEGKMYAGMFKSLDDLKATFTQIGGDATRYQTPEALEAAFEARAYEIQQFNAAQKAAQAQQAQQTQTQTQQDQPNFDKITSEVMARIPNIDQITTAQELVKAMIPALIPSLQAQTQPQLTGEKLMEMIQPKLNEYTQQQSERQAAVNTLEKEVPRLTTDQGFRNLFAAHLQNGNYTKDVLGLRTAMRDFMKVVGMPATQTQAPNKTAAQTAPENASNTSTTTTTNTKTNEVQDILSEYAEYRKRG